VRDDVVMSERTVPGGQSHRSLHHITPADLTGDTAQTSGMTREAAISGLSVGADRLWMGRTIVPPATVSAAHHHGESETGIYVVSGNPSFVFLDDGGSGGEPRERRIDARPGDFIYVPPFVPHREENLDPGGAAVVVIARSTQEAIVVNLPGLAPGQVPGADQ
jgi:uncharacterized RmlC-like cupin family protein